MPAEAAGCFGPRLAALVALLTGGYRVSKRNVRELLSDVLGVELALGSVSKLEARASEVLAEPHAEVLAHIRTAPHVNMDETSWTEDASKAWLWVASTPEASTTESRRSGAATSSPRSSALSWSSTPSNGRSAGSTSGGTCSRRSS
ncbi:IS66 family transposase [Nannocystis exedens]|uniref:IS66 family transposase n=1 Tax=Nannocystis exedens TaxID=54 RepID=UPI000BBA099E